MADPIFRYLPQNDNTKVILRAKNTKILYYLQTFLAKVSDFSTHNLSFLQ